MLITASQLQQIAPSDVIALTLSDGEYIGRHAGTMKPDEVIALRARIYQLRRNELQASHAALAEALRELHVRVIKTATAAQLKDLWDTLEKANAALTGKAKLSWKPEGAAPFDQEVLLCHDNEKAGIFLGTGFRGTSGVWLEGDARTPMRLHPTHYTEVPELPHERKRIAEGKP